MKIKQMVEDFLAKTPKFRERKHKDAGIVHLLLEANHRNSGYTKTFPDTKQSLTQFVKDYATADRAWRQALEHRKEWRGTDYNDKTVLMKRKQEELGYGKNG